jgi:hypothetical protein
MASTYTQPPMTPVPPPYRYRRSLAGPIVLIVIGCLFLLHNFGVRVPVWHAFGRYWPLLLILWGVVKLVEHAAANRQGYRATGIGGGSVLLLLLIIVFGLGAHYSNDVNWGGVRDQIQIDDDLGGMFGNAYTYDDNVEQTFPADATLRIVSDRGGINVQPDIGGEVKISLEKGSIRVTRVTGDVNVEGRVDDVSVDDVSGAVTMSGEFFSDIRVSKVAKTVTFKSTRSDITLASVPGDIEISGDELRGSDIAGPSRLVLHSKEVHLDDVSGDLELESSNGEIEVHAASKLPIGKMIITGRKGDVTLVVPPNAGFQLDATARKGDITTDFGSIKVDSTSGGSAKATGSVGNGAARLVINADHGDIKITKS